MTLRLCCIAFAGMTLALGCSSSHSDDDDAGGIMFDPRFADAGHDAGPPPSSVGGECATDEDCMGEGETCITDIPGGYCTVQGCDTTGCPEGSICLMTRGGGSFCAASCDPAMLDVDQCRPGFGCADDGYCFPGCEDDSDCDAGRECDPTGSFGGTGQCFTPGTSIGAACMRSEDCGEGQRCLSERRWGLPDGMCGVIFVDCDPATDAGCPNGASCLEIQAGGGTFGICLDSCSTDADCTRDGYECVDREVGSSYCGPEFDDSALGVPCSGDPPRNPCQGGICLSEAQTGYPDSMCVETGCDAAAQTGCGPAAVCVDINGTGVCHPECTMPTDCRAGYDCRPSDPTDPMSPTACLPGCDDDAVCGNAGFQCNTGTGLCRETFDAANLGEPCMTTQDDCPGGRCQSEEGDGWPAGMCTYPGCRLSGMGAGEMCPTGSVCVDDGEGDPAIGACVPECTMPTDCRPGYTCDMTAGACVPACTASDCGSTRTCNTTSGLCE